MTLCQTRSIFDSKSELDMHSPAICTHTHTRNKRRKTSKVEMDIERYTYAFDMYTVRGISRKYKKEKGEKSSNLVRYKFNSACAGRRDYMEHKRIFKEFLYKRCDLISFPQIVCFFFRRHALQISYPWVWSTNLVSTNFSLTLFYSVINIFRYLSDKLANGGGRKGTNDGGYAK